MQNITKKRIFIGVGAFTAFAAAVAIPVAIVATKDDSDSQVNVDIVGDEPIMDNMALMSFSHSGFLLTEGDERELAIDNLYDVIANTNPAVLAEQLENIRGFDKFQMRVNFADAILVVDAKVDYSDDNQPIITVEKMSHHILGVETDITSHDSLNVTGLKKHTEQLLEVKVDIVNASDEVLADEVREDIISDVKQSEFEVFAEELNLQVIEGTQPHLYKTFERLMDQTAGLKLVERLVTPEMQAYTYVDEDNHEELTEAPGSGWGKYTSSMPLAPGTKYLLQARVEDHDQHVRNIGFWRIVWFEGQSYFNNSAEVGSGHIVLVPDFQKAESLEATDSRLADIAIEKTMYEGMVKGTGTGPSNARHMSEFKEGTHLYNWALTYIREGQDPAELVTRASDIDTDMFNIYLDNNDSFWITKKEVVEGQ